jgi:hypothetical protein
MVLGKKFLWAETLDGPNTEKEMLGNAKAIGATGLCIRTMSTYLEKAIPRYQAMGYKVYGWRYPQSIDLGPHNNSGPIPPGNSYATNEAAYVINTLIPAGLDGYIMDIESANGPGNPTPWRDWDRKNDAGLKTLATNYVGALRKAADTCGRSFLLGFTSHANAFNIYPGTPWQPFISASDVLYPQSYWRRWVDATATKPAHPVDENGAAPKSALDVSFADYAQWGKPIIPIAGEMFPAKVGEMAAFGAELTKRGISEGHFYTSTANIDANVLSEIKAL